MHTKRFVFLLIVISYDIGVHCLIQLTPPEVRARENSSSTLTCSKTNRNLAETIWTNSQFSTDGNLVFFNNQCITTRFLKDSDLFTGVCNRNGTYSVVLNRIDRKQHGAKWTCDDPTNEVKPSNEVVIDVSVPATSVTLNPLNRDHMEENESQKVICRSSACRPDPRVRWYLRNNGTEMYNLTRFSTFTYIDGEYGLKAVESTLNLIPNRTVNGFRLYCEVLTHSNRADTKSRDVTLNITYPPDTYPRIQGNYSDFRVIESDTGTLVCSIDGGNPLSSLRWNCFGKESATLETLGKTVTSTIKWTARRGYSTCSCQANHINNWKRITNITVHVQYPPVKPNLTIGSTIVFGDVRVIRNNMFQVVCKSESNPFPNFKWTGPVISNKVGDMLNITSVESANQGQYICNASNRMTRSDNSYKDGSNSSSFNLIMLYPPSTPKLKFGNMTGELITSEILDLVKGDTFTIYCDVDGNPAPDVTWDNSKRSHTLSISSIVTDTKRTCTATNVMKETAKENGITSTTSAFLSINVFYPPDIPTINVSNIKGETVQGQDKIISIIESESINLTCFSNSKPMPTYQWVDEQSFEIQQGNILNLENIIRNENGTYACNVENVMNRSIGKLEEGKNKSIIILNILFPASIGDIEDKSAVEGSQLEKECPITNGNPSNSTIVWSRQTDKTRWDNKLHIRNVSRTDDSDYTCSVITEMFPTIGSHLKIEKKKSFHLNVFFKTEITKFSLNESSSGKTVVIKKMDNASLVCISEANPSSNITIENPRGDYISEVSNSNIARYTLRNASYVNAGEYTCKGRNYYTSGLSSSSVLILIVKCPPRPSSGDTSAEKVATILHVNVTLEFSAWNYLDESNKTVFSWLKEDVPLSNNGSKYIIRTDGLQTFLSIRNTTQHDLGLYRVNVTNSAGSYIHNFTLRAIDKPDPPIDFKVVNESITDTSVTLVWKPGFNGGFQQTFVILYKMKLDTKWLNKSINDTGNKNMSYTLQDLKSMQDYVIEMFAKNRKGNSAKTERLIFKTEASIANHIVSKTTNNSSIIAGSVSAFVVIVVAITIISVVLFLRKRRNKKSDGLYQNVSFFGKANGHKPKLHSEAKQKKAYNSQTEETTFLGNSSDGKRKIAKRKESNSKTDAIGVEGLQEVDDVPIIMNERTEYCNSKDEIDKIKRITAAELYAYVFGNEDDLEVEYQKLPTGLQRPCTFARKPENIALNRYNGIYPYDHCRVKIPEQPDFFINACYIDGYKRKKAYIASLGPTSKTTSDFKTFWQMIWHERSELIIMLTNLHELSGMKCEQYWPDEGTELEYGDVLVASKTTEVYAEYTVRTFEISKGNHQRSLTHLHYTAWPDKTVPEDVTSLLEFRSRMKDVPSTHNVPAVVHCSAGIGRTGTLIALDILIEEGLDVGSVNVFECVKSLRDQRVKMVQTLEQYVYIHKALVNSLSFECETFTRKNIQHHLDIKNDQHYSKLFKQLNMSVETNSATEGKERAKNTKYSIKNRQGTDIPGDRFRVFLQHTDGREGSDYINAVYVNSFKRKDHFITAQSPLANNVTDFISMIYHGDCSCIATMEDLKEPGMAVGAYLPEKNKAITFGNFEVTCSKFEENTTCVIRKMKIKYTGEINSGEKCFYHFQYTKWMTGNKTPGDVEDFVQFVQAVEEYADELGEDRSRVVVHCLKANERSCLFCALAIIMEKLKVEGSVNILNVVRHLRTRRRSAIVSKEQLKFCYEAASAYAKSNKH